MSSPASSVDADIQAAFAAQPPGHDISNVDPDIAGAFSDKDAPAKRVGWAEENLAGPSELIGSTIANIPHAAAHAAVDLYRRWTGGDTSAPDPAAVRAIEVPQGAGGTQLLGDIKNMVPSNPNDVGSQTQAIRDARLGTNPTALDVANQTRQVAGDVGNLAPVVGLAARSASALRATPAAAAVPTAEDVVNASRAGQSMGAAADGGSTVSKLTPETQAEIVRAGQAGIPLNQTALERHSVAESLPIPQRLTRGMATGSGPQISEEINSRRTNPEIGEHLDNLNQGLIDNIDELRRTAAPNAVGNSTIDNSQSLIDSLKTVGDTRDAAITQAYTQAKALGGNKLNMDGQSFMDDVNSRLKDPSVSSFLPSNVKSSVIDPLIAKGPENMTLDDFLASQKILGRAQRMAQNSGDGNQLHAINEVRDALENTQVAPETAADAKAAYGNASALAKANFDDMKTNPAYNAAYQDRDITPTGQDSDLNKDFAQKYILGGTRANLQRLRTMLSGDDTANETMTAVALNHLRESAGIKPGFTEGSFSQNGYNSAWATKIEPRANELLQDPQLIEQAQNLGKLASWEQPRSKSTFINSSNTATAERPIATTAKAGLSNAADAATEMLPGPGRAAVKLGKTYMNARSAAKAAAAAEAERQNFIWETIKPGAGIASE